MQTSYPSVSEFQIERSGLRFERGSLHYAWFQLAEQNGERRVRAVAFKELSYLPIETRDDPDVGVFQPQHLGVVQFYGAAAEAESEWAAAEEVTRRMAAVEATLANYPLSRLR